MRTLTDLSVILCLAFVLDLLFADPKLLCHPIILIGKLIAALERRLYRGGEKELFRRGILLWALVTGISFFLPFLILLFLRRISLPLFLLLQLFWCFRILAGGTLRKAGEEIYARVRQGKRSGDFSDARNALARYVGRDTSTLDEKGIIRGVVETIAENTSDGVTAPFFYMMIGGAPLGFFYKAVNTLDSMVGYKSDRYLYFGRFSARMDDVFNFLPARLTALAMLGVARGREVRRRAWRIFKRDRNLPSGPNSGQTESVMAGILGIQLGGDAVYFGKLFHKPTLGDALREPVHADIRKSERVMVYSSALFAAACAALRAGIVWLLA